MATEEVVPSALRDLIAGDLRPVRPLWEPWKRALVLAPLGLLLLVGVPTWWYHVRGDAHALGWTLLWGSSLIQIAAGVLLISMAFRQVVPGKQASGWTSGAALALGIGLALTVTFVTWRVSPTVAPPRLWSLYNEFCFRHSFVNGLPVLVVALVFAARGLMWRPAVVGALAGLAAGLMSDSGWRAFCGTSQPSHVLIGHVGAILALAACGALLAVLVPVGSRFLGRRP